MTLVGVGCGERWAYSAGAQKEYFPQVCKHTLTSSSLFLAGSIRQVKWWAAWRHPSDQALMGVSGVVTFLPLGSASRDRGRKAKSYVLPKVPALVFQLTGPQGVRELTLTVTGILLPPTVWVPNI